MLEESKLPELVASSYEFSENAKARKFESADGYDVWRWPEFLAFAKRLGLDMGAPTTKFLLYISCDELVKVIHEFNGQDLNTPRQERKW